MLPALACSSSGGDEGESSTGVATTGMSSPTSGVSSSSGETGETTQTTQTPTSAATTTTTGASGDSSTTEAAEVTSDPTTEATTETTDGHAGPEHAGPELLVCSFVADSVARFDLATGAFLGNFEAGVGLDGALGITVGPDGLVYVASEESNSVLRYGSDGSFVDAFVIDDPRTMDDETGALAGPGAVLFGADGRLYVSSFDSDAILRYDGATGAFIDVFVAEKAGGLDGPDAGMVFGPDGDLFVPGYYSSTVARFDGMTGAPLPDFTPGDLVNFPRTLVFHEGQLYVANEGSGEVVRYDGTTGAFVDVFVTAGAGGLGGPAGMVFDADGVLHVASVDTNEVLRFDASGAPLETLIDGPGSGVDAPTHIALWP